MCFQTIVLCGFCLAQVGHHIQPTCHPYLQPAQGHQMHNLPPSFIYPPSPYACPNGNCVASTQLHWALRNQQQAAMQQDKAILNYVPFHETKAQCNNTNEACNFALDGNPNVPFHDVRPQYNGTDESCAVALDAQGGGYPPQYVPSARVGPEWLSFTEWRRVLEMHSRGKNILEIAEAVDKNASLLRVYWDTYLKNASTHDVGPLPSARSTHSQSTADTSTGSDDELFPLGNKAMVPQEGAPHPSFLSRSEQELVWNMFQQNETVRSISEQLHKSRRKISQYINAYMRPRLLKLQAEEREAENRAGGTSTYIAPLAIPATHVSDAASTAVAAESPSRLFREPSLHSDERDLELELIDSLLLDLTDGPDQRLTSYYCGTDPRARPKSTTSTEVRDSPVDKNHAVSHLAGLDSAHHKGEPALPKSGKRRHDDEVQGEPQRASKRLRNRSLT